MKLGIGLLRVWADRYFLVYSYNFLVFPEHLFLNFYFTLIMMSVRLSFWHSLIPGEEFSAEDFSPADFLFDLAGYYTIPEEYF
jgi:hypothetical protein